MKAALLLLLVMTQKPETVDRAQGRIETRGEVWVGQRVTVLVKLSSPSYFATAASFDLPSVPGVVILPPHGRPLLGNEEVDGHTYTTQTHELAVYPQRAGTIRLPPIGVRFTSDGGIGKPPIPEQGKTKELVFEAKMPPGGEGLSTVITTPQLTLRESWKPEPGKAKLGSAFTRTVTVRAVDVPGMVLPPMRWNAPEGVGVYPNPATVTDSSDRDESAGQRVESVTYICEKSGTYRLPGVTLTWWDARQKQLRREQLPSRKIEVEAAAKIETEQESPPRKSPAKFWILGVVVVATTLGLVVWFLRKPLERQLAKRRAAQAESEATWFSRLSAACRKGDLRQIEQAILAWLDHVPNDGRLWQMADLIAFNPDPAFAAQLAALQDSLYGKPGPPRECSTDSLLRAIEQVRRSLLRTETHVKANDPLPLLNPGEAQQG